MTKNGNAKVPEVIQGKAITLASSPRSRLRLNSVREVRRELCKIYAEARCGEIPTQTATRLAYLLQVLAAMIRDGDMEDRIATLEEEIKRR
jgi:hypothetical protein